MAKNSKKRKELKFKHKLQKARKHINKPEPKTKEKIGPVYTMLPNPFADFDQEQEKESLLRISESSETKYQEALRKVEAIFQTYDPISLLATLANYGLTVGVGKEGLAERDGATNLTQAHVELCQALALRIDKCDVSQMPVSPQHVQEVWDAVINLSTAVNFREIAQDFDSHTQNEQLVKLLQREIRGHTQTVRNWGYYSQVINISKELYSNIDIYLSETYGFTASDAITFFELLVKRTEQLSNERYILVRKLRRIKNKRDMIFKYHEFIGLTRDKALSCIDAINIDRLSTTSIFAMLLHHYDLRLADIYEFQPETVACEFNMNLEVIKRIIDNFSFEFGDLKNDNIEYFHLSNPIWLRPIIKHTANSYFCFIPQMFFSFIFMIFDNLAQKKGKTMLAGQRAKYLEDKVSDIITTRFPESNIVKGLKWSVDATEYETDLIAFIDSHAIIVEAKSSHISEPALRGAQNRLQRHVNEILLYPSVQSKRLADRLCELRDNSDIEDELRKALPVNINEIKCIIRVSVSLEYFAPIQVNLSQLKSLGLMSYDFDACPSMCLANFETLFDILEHPVQIIHYLRRRQELEQIISYKGDELDLLGLYLTTLFDLGDIDTSANFIISGMSTPIDNYYNSLDAGVETAKPKPKISELFTSILKQLESRKQKRWTEIGVILSMFSPDDQRKLSKMIKKLEKNVPLNWNKGNHENTVMIIPPKTSNYALCYIAYNDANSSERSTFIYNAATMALERTHVKQCLIIAKNIDQPGMSYNFIGVAE